MTEQTGAAITLSVLAALLLGGLMLGPLRNRAWSGAAWLGLFGLGVVLGPSLLGLVDQKLGGIARPLFGLSLVLIIALAAARIDLKSAWRGHRRACLASFALVLGGGLAIAGIIAALSAGSITVEAQSPAPTTGASGQWLSQLEAQAETTQPATRTTRVSRPPFTDLSFAGALCLGFALMVVAPAALPGGTSSRHRQAANVLQSLTPLVALLLSLLVLMLADLLPGANSENMAAQLARRARQEGADFSMGGMAILLAAELAIGIAIGLGIKKLAEFQPPVRDAGAVMLRLMLLLTGVAFAMGLSRLAGGGGGWLAAGLCAAVIGALSRPIGHAALAAEETLGGLPGHLIAFALGVGVAPVVAVLGKSVGGAALSLAVLIGLLLPLILRPLLLQVVTRGLGALPLSLALPTAPVGLGIIMVLIISPDSPGEALLGGTERASLVVLALIMAITSWATSLAAPLLAPLIQQDPAPAPELATPGQRFRDRKNKLVIETNAPALPQKPAKPAPKPKPARPGSPPSRNPQATRKRKPETKSDTARK